MNELINRKLNTGTIKNKRAEVARHLLQSSPNISSGDIKAISTSDLRLLLDLYDKAFFDNRFKALFKGNFRFSLSRRMTKSAGKTICPRNIGRIKPEDLTVEIRMGVTFFFHYSHIEGSKTVCGIETTTGLEALQLVFEHELCHAVEFICFGESNCSADRFKTIAVNLFGHTDSHHSLPTNRQIARHRFGLNIGDKVSFTFEGKMLTGLLYNINKRATVMVRDKKGQFTDRKGNRYAKYYVPLVMLEKQ